MASNYNGDPDTFSAALALLEDSDPLVAATWRVTLERLLDNTVSLRNRAVTAEMRGGVSLRTTDATFTDTAVQIAASTHFGEENAIGPVVAMKAAQAKAVFDDAVTAASTGGAIPNLTTISGAAVSTAGRMVVVGATTPFCAFRIPGGSWTGGGNQIGAAPTGLVYSPSYNGFFAIRGNDTLYRSTDATSWAGIVAAVSNLHSIAVIGAGAAAGRVVVLIVSGAPFLRYSSDNGSTWDFSGAGIPNRLTADESGQIAGCPLVTRNGLNGYIHHAMRCDSGARLRVARSADGGTWESLTEILAPTGHTFASRPSLMICQSTGLMAIAAPVTRTSDAVNETALYTSTDGRNWSRPGMYASVATSAFTVAGGKVLFSASAALKVSDGVQTGVYST